MKKNYFAPELTSVYVDTESIIMTSVDLPENEFTDGLGDDVAPDKFES